MWAKPGHLEKGRGSTCLRARRPKPAPASPHEAAVRGGAGATTYPDARSLEKPRCPVTSVPGRGGVRPRSPQLGGGGAHTELNKRTTKRRTTTFPPAPASASWLTDPKKAEVPPTAWTQRTLRQAIRGLRASSEGKGFPSEEWQSRRLTGDAGSTAGDGAEFLAPKLTF